MILRRAITKSSFLTVLLLAIVVSSSRGDSDEPVTLMKLRGGAKTTASNRPEMASKQQVGHLANSLGNYPLRQLNPLREFPSDIHRSGNGHPRSNPTMMGRQQHHSRHRNPGHANRRHPPGQRLHNHRMSGHHSMRMRKGDHSSERETQISRIPRRALHYSNVPRSHAKGRMSSRGPRSSMHSRGSTLARTQMHSRARSDPSSWTESRIPKNSNNNNHQHEFESRIVGGFQANEGDYKFFASLDVGCGGSLIAPNMVLTAAHCGASTVGTVRIGSSDLNSGGITRSATTQCLHPMYDFDNDDYDFMLVMLDKAVNTTEYPLIELNKDRQMPEEDDMLTVIGFGLTTEDGEESQKLLQVDVPMNSFEQCNEQYEGTITDDIQFCAGFVEGGKDSCQGDSGGPIFELRGSNPVQVGVVSFGEGCARPDRSGVYARVSGGYDWIKDTMEKIKTGDMSACGDGALGDDDNDDVNNNNNPGGDDDDDDDDDCLDLLGFSCADLDVEDIWILGDDVCGWVFDDRLGWVCELLEDIGDNMVDEWGDTWYP